MALRGTVFIYQGEELGLGQSEVPFERLQDPFGLANWPLNPGRDGCRTPMPWQHDAAHGGFSAAEPWLPADPAHAAMAVDLQQADPGSMLNQTRALLRLRQQTPALRGGGCKVLSAQGPVLALRRGEDPHGVIALFNLGTDPAPVPPGLPPTLLDPAQCLWHSVPGLTAGRALPGGFAAFCRADC
jgi:alpha-glucosidase